MLKITPKLICVLAVAAMVQACQSGSTGALDLQGYPNINIVPQGETAAITPQQEFDMLASLNAALSAQPAMSNAERADFLARQKRLAEIARTHEIDTARIIAAR